MKPKRTWVLVADAGRARVLHSDKAGAGLRPVPDLAFDNPLPRTHDLVDDRQPRSFESVGSARHPVEPRTDPRRKAKQSFAAELAEMLDARLAEEAFDRLVIVAPPQVLGDLRKAFSARAAASIAKEVAKDLTRTPDQEIAGHLDLPFEV